MKKIYALMAGALCALTASAAGIDVNFASENPCWTVGQNGVATYADGHLNVKMADQGGKYRADLKYAKGETEGFTLDASKEKILAIKFIGKRPQGNMTLEIDNNGAWINKNESGKDIYQQSQRICSHNRRKHHLLLRPHKVACLHRHSESDKDELQDRRLHRGSLRILC